MVEVEVVVVEVVVVEVVVLKLELSVDELEDDCEDGVVVVVEELPQATIRRTRNALKKKAVIFFIWSPIPPLHRFGQCFQRTIFASRYK